MADPNAPTNPRMLRAAQRRELAVAMKLSGATEKDIGDALEVTQQAVSKMLRRALQLSMDRGRYDAEEIVQIETRRLDRLQRGIWQRAVQGDLGAIDRALKIAERRARLLGLDAPQKVEMESGPVEVTIKHVRDWNQPE